MVRLKYRYFLTSLHYLDSGPDLQLTSEILQNAIYNSIEENYGEFGLGHVLGRIKITYLALLSGTVLIRVPADFEKQSRVSLSSLVVVNSKRCVLNVIHVGGTIRSCQKQLVKHNVNSLHRQMLDTQDFREREHIKDVLEQTLSEIRDLAVS